MTSPTATPGTVVVRQRIAADVPVLVDLLAEQQAATRYPLRWPLPFPVEDFLVRPGEEAAWVAEVDGRVVGHVTVARNEGELAPAFTGAAGTDRLGILAVLFVAAGSAGRGIGRRLHDTAVRAIREADLVPALDVLPVHDRAVEVYAHLGWREVGRVRAGWLPAHEPDLRLMVLDR